MLAAFTNRCAISQGCVLCVGYVILCQNSQQLDIHKYDNYVTKALKSCVVEADQDITFLGLLGYVANVRAS